MAGLQVLVDDLAFQRGHRLERDRAAVVHCGLGCLICRGPQGHRAVLAVTGCVNDDALADLMPRKAMR